MSNSIKGIQKKFANQKDSLENKGWKINTQKTKLMESGLKCELAISTIDPYGVYGRATTNSMLCVKCRKWIHERRTKWKKVSSVLAEGFVCKRCKMMTRNETSVERLNDFVICYYLI